MDCRFITAIRIVCLVIFLCTTINVNLQSAVALGALFVSLFVLRPSPLAVRICTSVIDFSKNPFVAKTNSTRRNVDQDRLHQLMVDADQRVSAMVTYDAENTSSLETFESVRLDTPCIFARKAKLWGSDNWKHQLSLEENVARWIPTFFKFTCLCGALGLDGFVVQLPDTEFGQSIQDLSDGVRRLLTTLATADPAGTRCMSNPDVIGLRGWVFEFNKTPFFITSFSTCYPSPSPRHSSSSTFVLFQPEVSFARHNLPPDSADTNWSHPRSIRDHIRVAFRAAGCQYRVPDSVRAPMAHQVVRPLDELRGEFVKWWIERTATKLQ